MSDVVGYVIYQLLTINGEGHQPYHQVAANGMGFSGGMYGIGHQMLGYLIGNAADVANTVAALLPWMFQQLTPNEALAWVDASCPMNTRTMDGKYIGPAEFDATGRIEKPLADTAWEV
jgi:hypothetical protein